MVKISVCIATFNGEKYIRQQLESILHQLADTDEIIISDDSSIDNTIEVIEGLNDPRIKILKNQNFENALKHSSGDIIFLSDQDDVWVENKVDVMMQHLNSYDLIVCDCYITNADLKVIEESMFKINRSGTGLLRNTVKNAYLGCCMAFNRKVLMKSLPFPKDIPMHDIWLGMVANAFYKVSFLPRKLVYYRRHDANSVQWKEGITSVYSLREKLMFRFIILKNLLLLRFKQEKD
jgi:glycosyltransferase involved in cell wall biosynthesis